MTKIRTLSALVMAAVAITAILLLPTPWMMVLAAVLFLAGLWEWFELAEVEDSIARSVLLIANLAVMVALVWASRRSGMPTQALFQAASLIGVAWWLLALLWLGRYQFASNHQSWARVFKLAAGAAAVIPAWCALAWIHSEGSNGPRWLLAALATVWAADTGAYFAGRYLGKHKLAPRISPNKTIEGVVGGVIAGVGVGLGVAWFAGAPSLQMPMIALVMLLTVLFSVVGDLFESLLKRHVGAKDSGRLIPGHGGILDRIDGVLAALPVFAVGKALLDF